MITCSVNVSAHLMCREWHAITMVTFSHLLTTTVVSTAPNTRVQLTHLSNLTLLYKEYDDIKCNTALYNNYSITVVSMCTRALK